MLRPERDKLVGNARLEFMNRQSAKWKEARDRFLTVAKDANGGSLTREQEDAALQQFWTAVDQDLARQEEVARREMLKPVHQRAARDVSLAALDTALKFDPYKK